MTTPEVKGIGEIGPCPQCESKNVSVENQDARCEDCGYEKYVSAWAIMRSFDDAEE